MSARCSDDRSTARRSRARASRRSRSGPRRPRRPGLGERLERLVDGGDEVLAEVGDDAAERVGEAGPRRDQHLGNASSCASADRVQRPGAAEREQREVARIVAARQATPCGWRRPSCRWRRGRSPPPRRRVEAERLRRRARRSPRASPPARPPCSTASSRSGSSRPSDEIGVGDRRPRAAAAVADRPRRRARALAGRPAACPPRRREAIEPPPAPIVWTSTIGTWIGIAYSIESARDRRHAAEDQRHVGRGAAHVVGDDVGELARDRPAAPSPRRRSRPTPAPTSRSRPRARRRCAADTVPPLPCITSSSRAKPRAGELVLQALDVAVQHRLHRGVHGRRRAALVLAVLGDDAWPAVT